MAEQVKLKIDLHNGIVELEGSEAFTKSELPTILELLRTAKQAPHRDKSKADGDTDGKQKTDGRFENISDLLAAVGPETNNEIVASCAYYWAFVTKNMVLNSRIMKCLVSIPARFGGTNLRALLIFAVTHQNKVGGYVREAKWVVGRFPMRDNNLLKEN